MPHGEHQPVIVVEKSSGIGSFLWGAVIGAGVALLLAPRTGEETRAELRTKGRRLRARAEDTADEFVLHLTFLLSGEASEEAAVEPDVLSSEYSCLAYYLYMFGDGDALHYEATANAEHVQPYNHAP